jgi:hypothetical protein
MNGNGGAEKRSRWEGRGTFMVAQKRRRRRQARSGRPNPKEAADRKPRLLLAKYYWFKNVHRAILCVTYTPC